MAALNRLSHFAVPRTVEFDDSLPRVELNGLRFHLRTFGNPEAEPLIVVHGGPGGDSNYLRPLEPLSTTHHLVFYDQRGTGLSQRVPAAMLTLESSLEDLHQMVCHIAPSRPVRLLGHSWGAMLVLAYLGRHPERVSHAIAVEPGILTPTSAHEFVRQFKRGQSMSAVLPMLGYILQSPLVPRQDGHEPQDYVMTRLMNRAAPGGLYQHPAESMPSGAFLRSGFLAFKSILLPVLCNPARFTDDLTRGLDAYRGELLLLSSQWSFIGYRYQQRLHRPLLPPQTVHLEARDMGHNMLTLNPGWSAALIGSFLAATRSATLSV